MGDEAFDNLAPRATFNQSGTEGTLDRVRGPDASGERGGREDRQQEVAREVPLGQHESLAGLPKTSPGSHPAVLDLAAAYMRSAGLPPLRQTECVSVDPARATRIANAYTDMEHLPNDPEVAAAYAQMIKEILLDLRSSQCFNIFYEEINSEETSCGLKRG